MRFEKRTFTLLLLFIIIPLSFVYAQKGTGSRSDNELYQTALELYQQGKYGSSLSLFEQLKKNADPNSQMSTEATYYCAVNTLKLGNRDGVRLVDRFVHEYPTSPLCDRAYMEKGDYLFSHKKYAEALTAYKILSKSDLEDEEFNKLHFNSGYSYLNIGKQDVAIEEFGKVRDTAPIYGVPAIYYRSHLYYEAGKYDEALNGFKKIETNTEYRSLASYYIAHILYLKEKYTESLQYSIPLMNTLEADRQQALSRVAGLCYFHLKDYGKALKYLSGYARLHKITDRSDNYCLGYCYYKTGRYVEAIPYLEAASIERDEMSQNAVYHLADCYMKIGDKDRALRAFSSASEMSFDSVIKEDALFNYAKLTYELSYSPFNESIKAFDQYIALYPNTERNAKAYDFLVQVYMTTKNYKDALASIDKVTNKTSSIRKAYQRLTFYRGLELFDNQEYSESEKLLEKSIENGQYDLKLKKQALLWSGEAYFKQGNMSKAINGYGAFLAITEPSSQAEQAKAMYGIGYAYFNQKAYTEAAPWFKKTVNIEAGGDQQLYADALNRLGDCLFSERNFAEAFTVYSKSSELGTYDPDYALFQLAFCEGMLHHDNQKIELLRKLINNYSSSSLASEALYEMGLTYEKLGQNDQSLDCYHELVRKYPSGSMVAKTLLQSGLVAYNQSDYKGAVNYYKQVVEKYPKTQESRAALYGLKNSYVEMNQVDDYIDYTNKLGGDVIVSKSEQDSLLYTSAEKLYMNEDPIAKTQMEKYLRTFPEGAFALNAHFYLGEILYKEEKDETALANYEYVANIPANSFSEHALLRAAELRFKKGDYQQALVHYQALDKLGGSKSGLLQARFGVAKCEYELKNYASVPECVDVFLKSENINSQDEMQARFMKGKAFYQTNKSEQALPYLKETEKDTQTEEGAESKYLVAQIYFDQKNLSIAEKEILDFIKKGTPFQYWMARSFILLSDIYQQRGESFQAKETLNSLLENYTVKDDGIFEEATRKKTLIGDVENATQEKGNNSYEIKIDKNRLHK